LQALEHAASASVQQYTILIGLPRGSIFPAHHHLPRGNAWCDRGEHVAAPYTTYETAPRQTSVHSLGAIISDIILYVKLAAALRFRESLEAAI
jgi:hypothetical protein